MKRLALIFILFLAAVSERDVQAQTVDAIRDYTMVIEPLSTECDRVRIVGDRCGPMLSVVYIGEGLSGRRLFTTLVAQPTTTFNNGGSSTTMIRANVFSGINGGANTATLAVADSNTATGTQVHAAAAACEDLTYDGYDDWHLPASHESVSLFQARAHFGAVATVWTSTEIDQYHASAFNVSTKVLTRQLKNSSYPVQCVRRDSASVVASVSCDTVTALGQTCSNGNVVYAGHGVSGDSLFTTSFLLPVATFNSGGTSISMIRTNVLSGINGAANTATLAVADSDTTTGIQIHAAAAACHTMSYGGYSDWYLPGAAEAVTLFVNKDSLPVKTGIIWTSSEVSQSSARMFNIGTGAVTSASKSGYSPVQCVRKQTVPGLAPPVNCGNVTTNGGSCAGGSVLYVGVNDTEKRVYTTAFKFPSAFWNSGNTTSSTMITTGRTSQTDGEANTAALAGADADTTTGTQIHNAASICNQMSVGGFIDWYLPAIAEAEFLYANRAGLPAIGAIWSSTEASQTAAISLTALGARSTLGKATEINVQCIRKEDALPP